MAAQALSSLADNALFIAAIALLQELHGPDWMAPMMKWWFAATYVFLAAFVGAFSDAFPKGRVMFITNAVKILGCLIMFWYGIFGLSEAGQTYLVVAAFALVGVGAAAYSPAKYGIVTEMLQPTDLVKGNSWIEGLTVTSIILGTVLGGFLISPMASDILLNHQTLSLYVRTPAEAAILCIAFIYAAAAACNLLIPVTGIQYPKQHANPIRLVNAFAGYVRILWRDRLGQVSLAVTTLFWGAGATLQLIVIEWGRSHLGYRLDQASILMGGDSLWHDFWGSFCQPCAAAQGVKRAANGRFYGTDCLGDAFGQRQMGGLQPAFVDWRAVGLFRRPHECLIAAPRPPVVVCWPFHCCAKL